MKVSKEANDKAEYLREMIEAMTGQKITFKTVNGKPLKLEVEEDKSKKKRKKK